MFKTYEDVQEFLGTKTDRPYPHGRATRVQRRDNGIAVKYHETDVVLFTPDYVELNSGGWRTLTTKSRMNECLTSRNVSQVKGVWYIGTELFFDGIRIDYSGNVINPDIEADEKKNEIEQRTNQINKYAKDFMVALLAGEIDVPSGGDCWYCYFGDGNKSMGDLVESNDHLVSHLEESYFVPSLLMRACKLYASRVCEAWVYGQMSKTETVWSYMGEHLAKQAQKALVSYLKTHLGIGR